MRLVVDPSIWELFPEMRLVAVWAGSIDNHRERPQLRERLDGSVEQLRKSWGFPNPQSHPRIAAWRAGFKGLGLSGKRFPSSIEALTRRALSGRGIGSINPLVDLYNAVSLDHLVPAGGWDLDHLRGQADNDLQLTKTAGGERFQELGADEAVTANEGEVSYLLGDEVVTRHFVWRQSDLGKLAPGTTRAILVSEVLPEVGPEAGPEAGDESEPRGVTERAEVVRRDLVAGLRTYFQCTARSAVLTSGAESLAIDE